MLYTTQEIATSIYQPRSRHSHKGDHGHALIIAGNKGKMGAAIIASMSCLRSGVGLLTVNIPQEERNCLHIAVPEAMVNFREDPLNLESITAIASGPGMGINPENASTLKQILISKKPMVIDADALTLLSKNPELLDLCHEGCVLTPHSKEFDRIFGTHLQTEDRVETAIKWSQKSKSTVVIKGPESVIIQDNQIIANSTGNEGLAKGGSGDALTGIITALLCNGYSNYKAAVLAVYLHGKAADMTLSTQSVESMLISDVINNLGKAFKSLQN